jgi:diguanylate cyclase (GGDEF)-like protein
MRTVLDFFSLTLLRKIAIRYRLINSFVLVSLLPLLIAGVVAYRESSQASQDKIRIFAGEVVKQVAQNMLQQVEKIESSSAELAVSERMQNALAAYYSADPAVRAGAYGDITRLLLDKYGSLAYINQKYLLDRQRRIIDPQVFAQLGDGVTQFVANAPDLKGRPYWHIYSAANGQKSVVMSRDILFTGNNRLAGSLFIGITPVHFSRIFASTDLGYDSRIFVIDSHDGHLIVDAGQDDRRSENRRDMALIEAIARHRAGAVDDSKNNFLMYRDAQQHQQLLTYAPIPRTEWLVVSSTPLNALNSEVRSIRNKIILIGVLCFIVSFALSFVIARSISLPLQQLVGAMKAARAGNYLVRMGPAGSDEIALLAQRFNQMAGQVQQHNEQLEQLVAERTQELALANQKLEQLSATDSLTEIANRRRFDAALTNEMRRAARSKKPLGLLMLDVDFFKNYNDLYGHLAGDDCLRAVARALHSQSRRASDTAARYGGEEFAIIVADGDRDSVLQMAENVRMAIAALQIPHAASPFGHVTCSIGVALLNVTDESASDGLLRMADAALYQAKSRGRNQVVLNEAGEHDADMDATLQS